MKFEHRAILAYFTLGTLWIISTDQLAETLMGEITLASQFQTQKGLVYVGLTSLIFYLLLNKYLEELRSSKKALCDQHSYLQTIVNIQADEINNRVKPFDSSSPSEEPATDRELTPEVIELLEKLKENQSKLIKAEKAASLSTFTSGLAHEINNPLNFIKGSKTAIIVRLEELGIRDEEINRYLDFLDEGVNRASSIVDILIEIEDDHEDSNERKSIDDILDETVAYLLPRPKNRIQIFTSHSPIRLEAFASRKCLCKIFNAVLDNAVKSIEDEGSIHIESTYQNGFAQVMIKDTGLGIAADQIDRVTDPFFTTRSPGSGIGLGLFITERIIEKMGGKIEIMSNPKGTQVTLFIPAIAVDSGTPF